MAELSGCAVHTQTLKPWTLQQTCAALASAGVGGVSVWRNHIEPVGIDEAARIVRGSGLRVPALVRGGFFHAPDADAVNRACIDEAAALGAEMVVLVVGAVPGLPPGEARRRVADGIGRLLPHAEAAGVRLAIEPLHPMYAADKSCVNRLKDATDMAEALGHELVGVAADVYHVWWDPDVLPELARCGAAGRLFGFHVCDWRVPTADMLLDRGVVGEGCIDVAGLRAAARAAGFDGLDEIEVFSATGWAGPQEDWLRRNLGGYVGIETERRRDEETKRRREVETKRSRDEEE